MNLLQYILYNTKLTIQFVKIKIFAIKFCTVLFLISFFVSYLQEDFDQVEYVESLRESCCYAFSGIVQAMSVRGGGEGGQQQHYDPAMAAAGLQILHKHMQPVKDLISQIALSQPPPSDSLNTSACALHDDLAIAFSDFQVRFFRLLFVQLGILFFCPIKIISVNCEQFYAVLTKKILQKKW